MSLSEESVRGVRAAWGLLRRDPAAPASFNATVEGFWRSFAAAAILFPLGLVYAGMLAPGEGLAEVAPAKRWAIECIAWVLGWTVWPLLAFYLARLLGRGDRYLGYVVAYNWSQLITFPFLFGAYAIGRAWLPEAGATIVVLAATLAALAYEYVIARRMLGIPPAQAVMVELAAVVTGMVLRDAANLAAKLGSVPAG